MEGRARVRGGVLVACVGVGGMVGWHKEEGKEGEEG
jgi:hypothetical protein